jgi:hypothetical protein
MIKKVFIYVVQSNLLATKGGKNMRGRWILNIFFLMVNLAAKD